MTEQITIRIGANATEAFGVMNKLKKSFSSMLGGLGRFGLGGFGFGAGISAAIPVFKGFQDQLKEYPGFTDSLKRANDVLESFGAVIADTVIPILEGFAIAIANSKTATEEATPAGEGFVPWSRSLMNVSSAMREINQAYRTLKSVGSPYGAITQAQEWQFQANRVYDPKDFIGPPAPSPEEMKQMETQTAYQRQMVESLERIDRNMDMRQAFDPW
jgi:hypothetical protein